MTTFISVVHIMVCVFLVVVVLLQHGKGADIGATFGGSSQTVFGARGAATLLSKITVGAAVVFMLTSVSLARLSSTASTKSLMSEPPTGGKVLEKDATPTSPSPNPTK
jgi:preprotein translocase subunit SecG